MPISKRAVILAVVALSAAVVTALAAVGPEPKRDRGIPNVASTVLPEHVCPQEPWPFGCQWREPSDKLSHKPHSSRSHAGQHNRTSRKSAVPITARLPGTRASTEIE
jgi:hypothetical protein